MGHGTRTDGGAREKQKAVGLLRKDVSLLLILFS